MQFGHICLSDPHVPGLLSKLYTHLNCALSTNLPSYATQWAIDLDLILDSEDWAEICQSAKSSIINILALEANFKVLTRWFLVPARIAKMVPNISPNCFGGCVEPGTHLHVWWSNLLVSTFWAEIFQMLCKLTNFPLTPGTAVALLNKCLPDLISVQFKLLLYSM